jgi:HSP20 family protein
MSKTLSSLMEAARIQSEINRLFDNLLDLGGDEKGGSSWIPNADIVETESSLVLKVELPGVAPQELSLSVHGNALTIQGERRRPEGDDSRFHVAERQFGPFRRTIHLTVPVNTRHARAVLDDGLLRITFPKVPNRRGETVEILVDEA